jgi:16S rRNA (adenine1518-N6/adenine1519-N6)-dimethyltransferase
MKKKLPSSQGIPLKKKYGQYFLRDKSIILDMLSNIDLKGNSAFEIGCGDGFLTREILHQQVERLWVFEIDPEWAKTVEEECKGENFEMHLEDFLQVDLDILKPHAPWVMLSNLPYHLTFPILHRLQKYRHCIGEGVLMMQEEVAQKIVKTHGRGYGYVSLFFQYYFDWNLLSKVPPTAFYPQPKVFSRLIQFKTKENVIPIQDEVDFWRFIKLCFAHPRRTLRNNLVQTHIPLDALPVDILELRAQQMDMSKFLALWVDLAPLFIKVRD